MLPRPCIAGPSKSTLPFRPIRVPVRRQTTRTITPPPQPLKLAIIGSGPSGFYTASRILSTLPPDSDRGKGVEVHMYERLPTPYGLVRYGVAPDHPEVKNCQHKFDELSSDPRFRFFGNVSIGSQPSTTPNQPSPPTTLSTYTYPHALHIPLSDLLPYYSTILLTYGASLSNPLGNVSGSSSSTDPLEGVMPALAFVSWYNGHPAFSDHAPDLREVEEVTVVGQGNVALDVARILLNGIEELEKTDMPESVLDVLAKSKVRSVTAVGRRGPGQVAFTTKEFREMLKLTNVAWAGIDQDLVERARSDVQGDRMRTRLLSLMEKKSDGTGNGSKEFKLDFLKSPSSFLSTSSSSINRVDSIEWTINQLLQPQPTQPTPPLNQDPSIPSTAPVMARPTGETVTTKTDMVIESVGYRSEPLASREGWELPFDAGRGRVRNVSGRVVGEDGMALPGLYAAGWAARGPVGVIASTMHDAYTLSSTILSDHFDDPLSIRSTKSEMEEGIPDSVEKGRKEGKVVELEGWRRIDEAERERGRKGGKGKVREKFTRVEEMLGVLG